MEHLFDITYLVTTYGYIGIFSIVFLESGIFFALPGDSLLFTIGVLASADLISLYVAIPLIFIATLLGSIAGYYIGYYLQTLQKYYFFKKILKKEHIERAHSFFEHHGRWTMLISRFVPIVRTFAPIVAGIAKMNFSNFIKWNIAGSIFWSVLVPAVGYISVELFPEVKNYLQYFIFIVILISLLPIFWRILKKKTVEKSK